MAIGQRVCAFGIELRPLTESDLPLMLYWRRQPEVARYMDTMRIPAIQELRFWFKRIEKSENALAFVAISEGRPIGFTELKNIRLDLKSCEDGIFLYGRNCMRKGYGSRIILCRELVMRSQGLLILRNRIRQDNKSSIKFYQRYYPLLEGSDREFMYFIYKYEARLSGMKSDAARLGCDEEFVQLLGTR